ncbi:hypothetical protein GMA8713_02739 [Grimontia marina]|uniref:Uncharacterized protein n=1 Tax=Grimontia marina TaxID=646534 RepID=A0A128FAW9_9GAMM|nr:hypothetical protein GMA8713_02739 [Grimontia marina]
MLFMSQSVTLWKTSNNTDQRYEISVLDERNHHKVGLVDPRLVLRLIQEARLSLEVSVQGATVCGRNLATQNSDSVLK